MELLQEIDQQAKVEDFRLFLEDLKTLDADMEDETVGKTVRNKIELLKEMGRGDFGAHMGMAQAAGVRGHEAEPHVAGALKNPRLGLQQRGGNVPEKGQPVRYQGKTYVIDDTDGKMAFLRDPKAQFGGGGIKVDDIRQLKAVQTKKGGMGWVYMG